MQNFDLDLEKVEEALQEAKTSKKRDSRGHRDHSSEQSDKKNHNNKRSRSRSKKDKKRRNSQQSSSSSKKDDKKRKKRHRSRSSSSSSSSEDSVQRRERKIKQKIKEEELKKKQLEKEIQEQEQEEAKRDDCTVLMLQLPLKVTEKEIYQFLLKGDCGKIRDIRIIKDSRTGKSKGIAYIEFFYQESVFKAVALNSQLLAGFPVKIQPSQAEKNRISIQIPKNRKVNRLPIESQDGGPMRIYIGNLTEQLADITEQDVDKLFSQFGSIEFIDLHRDTFTGKCKGFAFVQYYSAESARNAILQMNGFNINGKQIKVSTVTQNFQLQPGTELQQQVQAGDLDEDYSTSYLHSSESRALLMQKLTRQDVSGQNNQIQNVNQVNILSIKNETVPNQPQILVSKIPSTIILLTNMFKLEEMVRDISQFSELQDDIEYECKKFGKLEKLHLDQKSLFGNVWVIYNDVQSAISAYNALNMRVYNGLQIQAYFVPENVFKKQFAQFLL